jgi:hypothetical protein
VHSAKPLAFLVLSLSVCACSGDDGSKTDKSTVDTGSPPDEELPEVWINEFMASNTMTLADETGAFPDWVELYNASDFEADLSGWWITDDNTYIFKHRFAEGVVIPAKGYIVVFCDGDTADGPLHTSFQLDALGEDLGLYGPNVLDNPVIDSLDAYGSQLPDVSLARSPDGSPNFVVSDPSTPGETNGG